MIPMREQIHLIVDDLPDDQVPAALAFVSALTPDVAGDVWPPAWFGAILGDRDDVAGQAKDMLGVGGGRLPA
ncbi:MAG TPA: hypothetical protein VGR21_00990 [Cryptosporangiaceae bacterium]|nr:hypothetical protein [Cryptosporangiaceae bacterium]